MIIENVLYVVIIHDAQFAYDIKDIFVKPIPYLIIDRTIPEKPKSNAIRFEETFPFSLRIFLYDMIFSVFSLMFFGSHISIGFLVVCLLSPKMTIEI